MRLENISEARILAVDDESVNVQLLQAMLAAAGYSHVIGITDPRRVSRLCEEHSFDLILLDLNMPHLDGFAVLEQLQAQPYAGSQLPILVLTADDSAETKRRALSLGATDFLTKPFDIVELTLRIRNALQTRSLMLELRDQNQVLEQRVAERTRDLELARIDAMERLARVVEYRDDVTHLHAQRVGVLSAKLAQQMGLPAGDIELIGRAAPLHDIGKIGTPDAILLKPAKLTSEEFERIKTHTTDGAHILANGRTTLIQMAQQLALTHHERWDGSGYPSGLRGEEIPLVSRIVTVTDVYDALTHVRPYKRAWTQEQALAEIRSVSGHQFDPAIVEVFLRQTPEAEPSESAQAPITLHLGNSSGGDAG